MLRLNFLVYLHFADICCFYHYTYCRKFLSQKCFSFYKYLVLLSSNNTIFFYALVLQMGFMLLCVFWEFDFPPFMVLVIAILNDG